MTIRAMLFIALWTSFVIASYGFLIWVITL